MVRMTATQMAHSTNLVDREDVVEPSREGMLRCKAVVGADDGEVGSGSGGSNGAQLLFAGAKGMVATCAQQRAATPADWSHGMFCVPYAVSKTALSLPGWQAALQQSTIAPALQATTAPHGCYSCDPMLVVSCKQVLIARQCREHGTDDRLPQPNTPVFYMLSAVLHPCTRGSHHCTTTKHIPLHTQYRIVHVLTTLHIQSRISHVPSQTTLHIQPLTVHVIDWIR